MKRFLLLAAAVAALGAVGGGSAWAAGSSGNGHQTVAASCTVGDVTVYVSSGQSAWTSDTHWVVQSFTGTFTAPNGTVLGTFSKTFGNKSGFSSVQECKGSQASPDGTFSFDTIVAPNPNG